VRVEVLVGNADGLAFWRAVGFRDYALTLEADPDAGEPGGAPGRGAAEPGAAPDRGGGK
jgi:hypothetical protein